MTYISIVIQYAGVLCVFPSSLATPTGTSVWALAYSSWSLGSLLDSSKISSASTSFLFHHFHIFWFCNVFKMKYGLLIMLISNGSRFYLSIQCFNIHRIVFKILTWFFFCFSETTADSTSSPIVLTPTEAPTVKFSAATSSCVFLNLFLLNYLHNYLKKLFLPLIFI